MIPILSSPTTPRNKFPSAARHLFDALLHLCKRLRNTTPLLDPRMPPLQRTPRRRAQPVNDTPIQKGRHATVCITKVCASEVVRRRPQLLRQPPQQALRLLTHPRLQRRAHPLRLPASKPLDLPANPVPRLVNRIAHLLDHASLGARLRVRREQRRPREPIFQVGENDGGVEDFEGGGRVADEEAGDFAPGVCRSEVGVGVVVGGAGAEARWDDAGEVEGLFAERDAEFLTVATNGVVVEGEVRLGCSLSGHFSGNVTYGGGKRIGYRVFRM